jgi:hypothetical protein
MSVLVPGPASNARRTKDVNGTPVPRGEMRRIRLLIGLSLPTLREDVRAGHLIVGPVEADGRRRLILNSNPRTGVTP